MLVMWIEIGTIQNDSRHYRGMATRYDWQRKIAVNEILSKHCESLVPHKAINQTSLAIRKSLEALNLHSEFFKISHHHFRTLVFANKPLTTFQSEMLTRIKTHMHCNAPLSVFIEFEVRIAE
jgi:hypothetical protein